MKKIILSSGNSHKSNLKKSVYSMVDDMIDEWYEKLKLEENYLDKIPEKEYEKIKNSTYDLIKKKLKEL